MKRSEIVRHQFSHALMAFRKENNLTQDELATIAGLNPGLITSLELKTPYSFTGVSDTTYKALLGIGFDAKAHGAEVSMGKRRARVKETSTVRINRKIPTVWKSTIESLAAQIKVFEEIKTKIATVTSLQKDIESLAAQIKVFEEIKTKIKEACNSL